jgi:hypothetical protein
MTEKSKAPVAETKAAAPLASFTCSCGKSAKGEDAAAKHRAECGGQWLAEPEPIAS